ncbi:MAG: amidase [Paucibacter sp.]|nr:amidase [Roseateles sp.]
MNAPANFLNRRGFVAGSLTLGAGLTQAGAASQLPVAPMPSGRFDALDLQAIQQGLAGGQLSCESLTRHYLRRINTLDRQGPQLRSVIELNPHVLAEAQALDRERRDKRRGPRGPLHGVPVLIKDNIATADAMSTTAGSLMLAGLHASRDAFLVTRLRAAGALILGKTNLSEWANIRSSRSTSGWSSRGGQTRHPHVLARNPSGSSSGSAVAVAAGLCALAVGTETDGSIISPASICGIVGLKPTVGLVSRSGIIPISASQDTAGPMTRHVRDAAALLQVLAAPDTEDRATAAAPKPVDYLAGLRKDALRGARIGVLRSAQPPQPQVNALFEEALAVLKAQGAVLVDQDLKIPHQEKYGESEMTVLMHELKAGLAEYLAAYQPDAPAKDLAGLIEWNKAHAKTVMPFFDQELFDMAQATQGLDAEVYRQAVETNQRYARKEGLDALFAEHQLDAVVAPSGNLAWLTDPLLGDHFTGGGFTSPFAVAGYPHLTVPMGLVSELPAGISFGGLAWQEAKILAYGYAYEQASLKRAAPKFLSKA